MADRIEDTYRRALAQIEGMTARMDHLMRVAQAEASRARDLEAALRALTDTEPVYHDREGYANCCYCPASKPIYGPRAFDAFVHAPDCPWVTAKALLGGSGDAPDPAGTSTAAG